MTPPLFGITGWKSSGKTTLTARLVAELTNRGYALTAIKHAHESFDIDQPGRDSYRLREAGARRVIISSPKRWALMHELGDEPEMPFEHIVSVAAPCDLILIEGFKREQFPKMAHFSPVPLHGRFQTSPGLHDRAARAPADRKIGR